MTCTSMQKQHRRTDVIKHASIRCASVRDKLLVWCLCLINKLTALQFATAMGLFSTRQYSNVILNELAILHSIEVHSRTLFIPFPIAYTPKMCNVEASENRTDTKYQWQRSLMLSNSWLDVLIIGDIVLETFSRCNNSNYRSAETSWRQLSDCNKKGCNFIYNNTNIQRNTTVSRRKLSEGIKVHTYNATKGPIAYASS